MYEPVKQKYEAAQHDEAKHAAVKYGSVIYEPVKHRAVKYKRAAKHSMQQRRKRQ